VTGRHPQVFVRPEKAGVITSRHPWVLEKSIIAPTIEPAAGTVVDLVLPDGRWLARGKYNPGSRIRVRLYQWTQSANLDESWLRSRLEHAWQLRKTWMEQAGEVHALRLLNSEGDGLSGLVIDRFGDYIVVQVNAAAVLDWVPVVTDWLQATFQPLGILQRIDSKLASIEAMEARDAVLAGNPPAAPLVLSEQGVKIQVDLMAGQKTGYYLDQRSNRRRAAEWARGRMLDVCTYLGGFALAAARQGRIKSALALDSSARALAEARRNAELNGIDNIEFREADAFEALDALVVAGESFDTIVLDPPRMAGSREQQPAALRAYHRLNSQAIKLLSSGGVLVTCSCSGRVSREEFAAMLAPAARRAGRSLQILEQWGADVDHPWDAACPETEYLKCFICRAH
jgi:23S rRNA (cytosine1962-C5)-methyltransferase